jgi:hypothetical protein
MMTKDTAPLVITLDEVMADYDGKLSALLAEHTETPNILITWQVDIEVKDSGMQAFFVAVSVCFDSRQDDELRDIASQLCPDNKTAIFAFVPAYSYGRKDFGIFIAENQLGEILVNGLVNEVIEQAGVEQAVVKASKRQPPRVSES